MTDPFTNAEREFLRLKVKLAVGRISSEQFNAAVEKLSVRDAQGRIWKINPESGNWHVRDATGPDTPPERPHVIFPLPKKSHRRRNTLIGAGIAVLLVALLGAGLVSLVNRGGAQTAQSVAATPTLHSVAVLPTDTPLPTPTVTPTLAPSATALPPTSTTTPTDTPAATPTSTSTVPATATSTPLLSAPTETVTSTLILSPTISAPVPTETLQTSPIVTETITTTPTLSATPAMVSMTGTFTMTWGQGYTTTGTISLTVNPATGKASAFVSGQGTYTGPDPTCSSDSPIPFANVRKFSGTINGTYNLTSGEVALAYDPQHPGLEGTTATTGGCSTPTPTGLAPGLNIEGTVDLTAKTARGRIFSVLSFDPGEGDWRAGE